ncbi:EscE/YscE/SsaE family type III secretion system needle protein co-chaperone [Pseudomonas sp. 6D_7.1_Bac1]|jgi:type III secretion system YseE family protein|uniref:EscE/YscE/SsaE family type III secretion system needle protein co-chaperone n=1 Tax=Pseudomonas sp. 6D_7.1_Bac1 TaxID=2971615 RepID=UPI0021C68537|nr:EscE/YscE/SsaE family type III secretion system needle protein co-chaperone [Pseudomonas sp. 6D_7.1_Bac1]MCU1748808.1 EscE/YscE/SsaE family type III secretion system needle protein co-chaperone [Pseudomonas sp. 6D_7.1_Bac1]
MARITYLEDALHADTQGRLRDNSLNKLRQAEQQLREQLRLPQAPAQYQALEQCASACASAAEVIETLWCRYHPR